MSRKGKGSNAERELVHLFHKVVGWSAVRVAGSGSNKYPSPDIIAANGSRYLAIECKATRDEKKYLDCEDIDQIVAFAKVFGAEPWIAVRFIGRPWYFIKPENLEKTGRCFGASLELLKEKGFILEGILGLEKE